MQFLVNGATRYGEPGVFLAFEESSEDLAQNVASLGYDLPALIAQQQLRIDHVELDPGGYDLSGEFDLEGLFIRLGLAIDAVGAKRVVLDTLETLFSGLPNPQTLRAELHRLFHWLKQRGVTAIITGEKGEGTSLTRQGLEEYVSDCVIALDNRVDEQISSRRLRVVKYRGSTHGANEYPFLITRHGISLLPITSLELDHEVSSGRVTSGVEKLDAMLGGAGYFRGSSIMISGTAGTGKSSLAAHLANASCARGEQTLYLSFEESAGQILRNMRSIGIDLSPWVEQGVLHIQSERPTSSGLEQHLLRMVEQIREHQARVVILDPISSFLQESNIPTVKTMLLRLVDFLKSEQITTMLLNLTSGGKALDHTDIGISSLMDTWLLLRNHVVGHDQIRTLGIIKSRGMAHSAEIRRYLITDRGVDLGEAYNAGGSQ